jgi:hypothetical protein
LLCVEEHADPARLVHICSFSEEETQMFRITRIVPATAIAAAALALAAPVAQAKPLIAPSGGPNDPTSVVKAIQAADAEKQAGVVITTGDMPLANPVHLPQNLNAGLMHAQLAPGSVQPATVTTAVTVPETSGKDVDWTAAAIGSALVGILLLSIVAGFGFRRRGGLAT